MHERAAEALGLRCHYQLLEVAGAGREELKALLEGVRRLGFAGINVTFPYKEAVVDLLDELSPGAARIGAVNTVVVRDGRLIGHNTDTTGFARAVRPARHRLLAWRGRLDRRRRRRQGDCVCAGRAWRHRFADLRLRACQGRASGRAARRSRKRTRGSQRRGCAARRRRHGQRFPGRDAAQPWHAGSGMPCCMPGCGSRTPSIRRYGRRCLTRRQGPGRHGHDRARTCHLSGRRRV